MSMKQQQQKSQPRKQEQQQQPQHSLTFQFPFEKYCSEVEWMTQTRTRHLPPLRKTTSSILPDTARERDDDTVDEVYYATHPIETQLLHTSVMFRHGARAPYAPLQCWNGYNYNNDNGNDGDDNDGGGADGHASSSSDKWDCPKDVSNYMTTSPKASTLAAIMTEQGQGQQQAGTSDDGSDANNENEGEGLSSSIVSTTSGDDGTHVSSWHESITSWFNGSSGSVGSGGMTTPIPNIMNDIEEDEPNKALCYGHNPNDGCPTTTTTLPFFLFDKQYDGLERPEHNYLGGTCVVGQLLREGYDQHYLNGQILRDTYLRNTNNQTFMNLFQVVLFNGLLVTVVPSTSESIRSSMYLRSDDEQRTLLSLQILFESFLGYGGDNNATLSTSNNSRPADAVVPTVVPLHTADLSLDVMDENDSVCPMLDVIWEQAQQSSEYIERTNQAQTNGGIIQQIQSTLGTPDDMLLDGHGKKFVDCLMTQYCTEGRDVPEWLKQNDYHMMQQAYDYVSEVPSPSCDNQVRLGRAIQQLIYIYSISS
jgi:hypothetical protein